MTRCGHIFVVGCLSGAVLAKPECLRGVCFCCVAGMPQAAITRDLMLYFLSDQVQNNLTYFHLTPLPHLRVSASRCPMLLHFHLPAHWPCDAQELPAHVASQHVSFALVMACNTRWGACW